MSISFFSFVARILISPSVRSQTAGPKRKADVDATEVVWKVFCAFSRSIELRMETSKEQTAAVPSSELSSDSPVSIPYLSLQIILPQCVCQQYLEALKTGKIRRSLWSTFKEFFVNSKRKVRDYAMLELAPTSPAKARLNIFNEISVWKPLPHDHLALIQHPLGDYRVVSAGNMEQPTGSLGDRGSGWIYYNNIDMKWKFRCRRARYIWKCCWSQFRGYR
jgi:hypothetical protein